MEKMQLGGGEGKLENKKKKELSLSSNLPKKE